MRQRRAWVIPTGLMLSLLLSIDPVTAGDPAAGQEKAVKCKQCHGLDGLGKLPIYPNLAGQSTEYLTKQLHDFQQGRREDQMMTFLAKELTEDDIADLAAYYASIEITVKLPQ